MTTRSPAAATFLLLSLYEVVCPSCGYRQPASTADARHTVHALKDLPKRCDKCGKPARVQLLRSA